MKKKSSPLKSYLIGGLCLVWLVLLMTSCVSTVDVATDYDRGANFAQYRTWNWYQEAPVESRMSHTLERYDTFLDRRIRAAVEREMSRKGYTKTASSPGVLIAYDVTIETKTSSRIEPGYAYAPGFGWGYGYWYGYRYNYGYSRLPNYVVVNEYNEGTIIIDVIDAKENQLIWRGTGAAVVDDKTNSITEKRVNEIVQNILAQYPPR